MAFDLNNLTGFEEDVLEVEGTAGGGGLLDLNIPAVAETAGEGDPYGVTDLNVVPDLDDDAKIASGTHVTFTC